MRAHNAAGFGALKPDFWFDLSPDLLVWLKPLSKFKMRGAMSAVPNTPFARKQAVGVFCLCGKGAKCSPAMLKTMINGSKLVFGWMMLNARKQRLQKSRWR